MSEALKQLLDDDRRACLGYPLAMFFPIKGDRRGVQRAKAICHYCPVTTLCAKAGRNEPFGIWGGMTPIERNRSFRPQQDLVSAVGSTRRLQALARYGYGPDQLWREFEAVGITLFTAEGITWVRRGPLTLEHERAQAIALMYGELVERGPSEAPYSISARKQADRQGWPWPEDWAGRDMDDPDEQPRVIRKKAA
jgi:hypothetical protein